MKFLSLVVLAILSPILCLANVTSTVTKTGPFTITGSPQVIPTGFPFQQGSDLLVLDYGTTAVTHDPALILVRGSDFSVTGGGYNSANAMQTGSISVVSGGVNAVAIGDNIIIMRASPLNQTSSFTASGPLTIQLLEQMGDKMATLSQQVNELGSRSLHFEDFETQSGLLSRSARAGNILAFDASGNISYSASSGSSGTTYTAGSGLLLSSNQFSINPTQVLTGLTVTNAINGAITGNANSATQLVNGRYINNAFFDGTSDVIVTAAAGTLTGASLNPTVTAAPGLLSASVGTFGSMATQNSATVAITGGAITGMPSPTSGSDVATKTYVDNNSTGLVQRTGVQVATTANLAALAGEQTIDGVLTAASRILVKNQTLSQNNGVYVTAAGAWARAADSNTAATLKVGYYYFVSSGTTQGSTGWTIQTQPTTLGVDPVVFGQFSASTTYTAGSNLALGGNVFSIPATIAGLTINTSAFNGTVGATTPSTVSSTGGALNGSLGLTTPASASFSDAGVVNVTRPTFAITSTGVTDKGRFSASAAHALYSAQNLSYDGANWNRDDVTLGGIVTQWTAQAGPNSSTVFYAVAPGANPASLTIAGLFSLTGLNQAPIGATTPSTVNATVYTSSSNANIITSKANFRLTEIDIRDYGATTASGDNTAAINAAITAAATGQSILIPEGTWQFTGTLSVSGKTGLTIRGTGMGSILSKTANFGNTGLNVGTGTTNFTLSNVALQTTTGSRLGGHLVVLNGDGNRLTHCRFTNSSEFTVFAGSDSSNISTNVTVDNCEVISSKADGIHFGAVRNGLIVDCLVRDTADDAIAVAGDVVSSATYYSDGVLVANNKILTGSSRGILLEDCQNVSVIGNYISETVSAGIWTSTYRSTSWFNTNITIKGNVLYNVTNSSGSGRAGILCAYTNKLTATENYVYNTTGSTLSGLFLCDCSSVTVANNEFWNTGVHGVVGYNSTTTGPADFGPLGRTFTAAWTDWDVSNNYFNVTQNAGGIAVYIIAPSTAVVQRVTGMYNRATNWQGASYIAYGRNTTAKYIANVSLEGKSVTDAGGNTTVTASPNY